MDVTYGVTLREFKKTYERQKATFRKILCRHTVNRNTSAAINPQYMTLPSEVLACGFDCMSSVELPGTPYKRNMGKLVNFLKLSYEPKLRERKVHSGYAAKVSTYSCQTCYMSNPSNYLCYYT